MKKHHASFCILGEVIEILRPKEPAQHLLIDISAPPGPDQEVPDFAYRTSFSATDPKLISNLLDQVSQGDLIEATGSFWQAGYVPHRTAYIDTTFCLSGYRLIQKRASSTLHYNPYRKLFLSQAIH